MHWYFLWNRKRGPTTGIYPPKRLKHLIMSIHVNLLNFITFENCLSNDRLKTCIYKDYSIQHIVGAASSLMWNYGKNEPLGGLQGGKTHCNLIHVHYLFDWLKTYIYKENSIQHIVGAPSFLMWNYGETKDLEGHKECSRPQSN